MIPGVDAVNPSMWAGAGGLLTGLAILLWKYLFGAGRARDGAESGLYDNLSRRLADVEAMCSTLQNLHKEETAMRLAAELRVVQVETEYMRKVARLEIRIEQLAAILRGLGATLPPFTERDDHNGDSQ